MKQENKWCKNGRFKKGNPGGGRPKGSLGKFTQLKNCFIQVFESLGGEEWLEKWVKEAKINKREFLKLLVSMIPKDLKVDTNVKQILIERPSDIEKSEDE